jgi:hypothetical protein
MNRAEVGVRPGLRERVRELFVRIEHFGLERLCVIRAHNGVGDTPATTTNTLLLMLFLPFLWISDLLGFSNETRAA